MSQPVRVAIVGNSFASAVQLPALRWAGNNEVVGIAGADVDKAKKTADKWSIPFATGTWRELLELDPDLFIITTPVDLHAEMVFAALETPAAILCEKPFALTAEQAAPLVEAAEGRLALIDHQLRWSPWRRKLGELILEGFLGDPWSARLSMIFGSPSRIDAPYSWWYDADRGGGTLGAIVSHMVDGLVLDLGPVDEVRARLCTYRGERVDPYGELRTVTADEHATLWLRMACGAEVSLESNLMAPAGTGSFVEYVGSEGTLRLVQEEQLAGARHGDELFEIVPDSVPPTPEEMGMPERGAFARMLPLFLRDVLQTVAEGRTELAGAATFGDGFETQRVLDAARRSAQSARWETCF